MVFSFFVHRIYLFVRYFYFIRIQCSAFYRAVGQVVETTVHSSSGVRSLGIDLRFPPLQVPKVESTCAAIKGHKGFIQLFFGPRWISLAQRVKNLCKQKKKNLH